MSEPQKYEDFKTGAERAAYLDKIRRDATAEMRKRERELDLMEAGLVARPLDQDFFNLCRMEYEHKMEHLKLADTMTKLMRSANADS